LKSARALTLVTRISLIKTHLLSEGRRKCTSEQSSSVATASHIQSDL
ncbi:hypothetical protein EVA_21700, partial [gut metagenome]